MTLQRFFGSWTLIWIWLFPFNDNPRARAQLQSSELCLPSNAVILFDKCLFCTQDQHFQNGLTDTFDFDASNISNPTLQINCPVSSDDFDRADIAQGAKFVNGRTLNIVTIERQPFVKVGVGGFDGVCFELFYAVQTKYNFTSNIFLPYDGNWGAELSNGSWNGMVGLVFSQGADMGVAGFSVTLERSKVVAFTESFHQEPTGILIPPPTEGEKLSVLIRPLSSQVWTAVLLTIIVLAPTLYTMHIISLRISGDKHPLTCKGACGLIIELFHFMIGSLVQESVVSPVNKTTRFLIILWWFLTLIVSNIYVAYLVSYLSAPRLHNVVDSLEDLVNQKQIKWTFRKNAALQSLFKSPSSMGVYKHIGDGVSENELVNTDYEGAQRALTGIWAFIKEKSFLDVALGEDFKVNHKCRITLAKQMFFKVETALILQKRSQLLPVVNNEIRWSVATGLMEKWKRMHWPRDLWCEDAASYISKTQPKVKKLQIEDVQGALFLLVSGLCISIVSFSCEVISHLCVSRKLSKSTLHIMMKFDPG